MSTIADEIRADVEAFEATPEGWGPWNYRYQNDARRPSTRS